MTDSKKTICTAMTPEERKAAFDRLFESIPGKNIDRINKVCSILFCKQNSVRLYRMKKPARYIPEAKIYILQKALDDERKLAKVQK